MAGADECGFAEGGGIVDAFDKRPLVPCLSDDELNTTRFTYIHWQRNENSLTKYARHCNSRRGQDPDRKREEAG